MSWGGGERGTFSGRFELHLERNGGGGEGKKGSREASDVEGAMGRSLRDDEYEQIRNAIF